MANVSVNANHEIEIKIKIQSHPVDYDKLTPIDKPWFMDVIGSWSKILITAISSRRQACLDMLIRNQERIFGVDKQGHVFFHKQSGKLGVYCPESDEVMEASIKALQQSDWGFILGNKKAVNQIHKALYWLTEEQRQDQGLFSFTELLTALEWANDYTTHKDLSI